MGRQASPYRRAPPEGLKERMTPTEIEKLNEFWRRSVDDFQLKIFVNHLRGRRKFIAWSLIVIVCVIVKIAIKVAR
jgi:hypothetical protein